MGSCFAGGDCYDCEYRVANSGIFVPHASEMCVSITYPNLLRVSNGMRVQGYGANLESLHFPVLNFAGDYSIVVRDNLGLKLFDAPLLRETGQRLEPKEPLVFIGNPMLKRLILPELEEVGVGLRVADNQRLHLINMPKLTAVNGFLDIDSNGGLAWIKMCVARAAASLAICF